VLDLRQGHLKGHLRLLVNARRWTVDLP
jgi:hypothetical protein